MLVITESHEWILHERHGGDPSSVRRYEHVCWDKLFGKKDTQQLLQDLNNRWVAHGVQLFVFDSTKPEDFISLVLALSEKTPYTIEYHLRPSEHFKKVHENY